MGNQGGKVMKSLLKYISAICRFILIGNDCKDCDSKEPCDKLYDKTGYNWCHKTFRP